MSKTPLLYAVSPPGHPEVKHYLLGYMGNLTKEQTDSFADDIRHSEAFNQAGFVVMESVRYVSPPARDCEAHHERGIARFAHAMHHIKVPKGLATQLFNWARERDVPCFGLDTPTYIREQKFHVRFDKAARPETIAKASVLTSFFGIPALAYIGLGWKRNMEALDANRNDFMREDLTTTMQMVEEDKIMRARLIRDRNRKWKDTGYDGSNDTPFTGHGLFEVMKDRYFTETDPQTGQRPGGMFIAVTAAHVLDNDYGLRKYLRDEGFSVQPVEHWRQSPVAPAAPVEPVEPAEAVEAPVRPQQRSIWARIAAPSMLNSFVSEPRP